MRKGYQAGLYMRLSKDDEGAGESASISTQRKMLRSYAKENGFPIYREYVDDGFSGTNFERPAWQQLIGDIEAKRINLVITKDLSRLGRDYILTGQLTELYFPSKKVRYIAINDGYDSDNSYNDIAPFKNIMNEMYARDTSKKIRSAFQTKIREGAYIGNFAPFGYKKDPMDKNHLLVDPVAASVVIDIFKKAQEGKSPGQIAADLNEREVFTPLDYRFLRQPEQTAERPDHQRKWRSGTICKILGNPVYLGHVVQGKTSKLSFKSNITLSIPRAEWVVVKNMHEPIISQEVFDQVTKRSVPRKRSQTGNMFHLFSGIALCRDCGRKMSVTGKPGKMETYRLVCGGYKQYGTRVCTSHSIGYSFLYQVIAGELNSLLTFTSRQKEEIRLSLEQKNANRRISSSERTEKALRKRERELFLITTQLYEDKVNERISEEHFFHILKAFEKEKKDIESRLLAVQEDKTLTEEKGKGDALFDWLEDIGNQEDITAGLMRLLIDKIEIGENQEVWIYFKTLPPENDQQSEP